MARSISILLAALLCCAALGCDDAETPSADTSSADTASTSDTTADVAADTAAVGSFEGVWRGDFTVSLAPNDVYWVEGTFNVDGDQLSGTITTENGRVGQLSGVVTGSNANYGLVYTDSCTGTATGSVHLVDADTLSGTIESDDCAGVYTGELTMTRQ